MKKGIHPEYRPVVFVDVASDTKYITRSTVKTKDKTTVDGTEYPMVRVDISAASHPFYTGQQKFLDTAGRVEKFTKKFGGEYFKNRKK